MNLDVDAVQCVPKHKTIFFSYLEEMLIFPFVYVAEA